MKRRYKIAIIILISILLTSLIYVNNKNNKINIVAFGDGISSGINSYGIDDISYNDYIKNYFSSKKLLNNYNDTFSNKGYYISDLNKDLENNNESIKQLINKANIITIGTGEEELTKASITSDLDDIKIQKFIKEYDLLLSIMSNITEGKIIIIGLYENTNFNRANTIIINSELHNLASKYNITFIDISDVDKNFGLNNSMYFDYKTHKVISDMIINSI